MFCIHLEYVLLPLTFVMVILITLFETFYCFLSVSEICFNIVSLKFKLYDHNKKYFIKWEFLHFPSQIIGDFYGWVSWAGGSLGFRLDRWALTERSLSKAGPSFWLWQTGYREQRSTLDILVSLVVSHCLFSAEISLCFGNIICLQLSECLYGIL